MLNDAFEDQTNLKDEIDIFIKSTRFKNQNKKEEKGNKNKIMHIKMVKINLIYKLLK